ncbi:hypothetical protein [Algihabitans albus]|nr:hypothetical protein [Algihabitans albus]
MAFALIAPAMACAAAIGPLICKTVCSQRCICSADWRSAASAEI